MITKTDSARIEATQKRALRSIFPAKTLSYEERLELAGIKTLEERIKDLCQKFTLKTLDQNIYNWFPKRTGRVMNRLNNPFLEEFAATKRLYDSPIFAMRRRLNKSEEESVDLLDLRYLFT